MHQIISVFKSASDNAIQHLKAEFGKLQTGSASSALVEGLMIEVYGAMQPLKNVASVAIPEPRTITIQPWDKANLRPIDEAIRKADIGINPVNKGESIILNIPPLTEERRKDLVKVVKRLAEEAKISVRQLRQDAQAGFKKKKQNDEMTEDELHGAEKKLQEAVDLENAKIEELSVSKQKAEMTV